MRAEVLSTGSPYCREGRGGAQGAPASLLACIHGAPLALATSSELEIDSTVMIFDEEE